MPDPSTPRDAHADERLRDDKILWLGTVRPDGQPHLVPVWFLWDGATILIFSIPEQQKIRNLRQNSHAILALDDTKDGEEVITIEGTVELVNDPAVTPLLPAYAQKYGAMVQELGMDSNTFAARYAQALRVTPTRFFIS